MNPVTWRRAARIAAEIEPTRPTRVGLTSAVGNVLAQPVAALADLPPVDCADARGYAIRGIGPWTVRESPAVNVELRDGEAVAVVSGGLLPVGGEAVLTADRVLEEQAAQHLHVMVGDPTTGRPDRRPGLLEPGHGIRPAKSAARAGELLIKAGATITSGTIGLAAAAGADDLLVIPPPAIAIVMRNEGLLPSGPPRRGRDRALLASLAPSWVISAGARCLPDFESPDEVVSLANAIDSAGADLVIVTASAIPETLDVADAALRRLNAEILIDELNCQPGGRVTLAELRDGRRVLCLPPDPASAIVALATILNPAIASMSGKPALGRPVTAMLRKGVAQPDLERAIPVIIERGELADLADPQPWSGPHGLAPLGVADGIAFIDQNRGMAQESVPIMPLPGAE
jgi:molybdopterin molybdotransferase